MFEAVSFSVYVSFLLSVSASLLLLFLAPLSPCFFLFGLCHLLNFLESLHSGWTARLCSCGGGWISEDYFPLPSEATSQHIRLRWLWALHSRTHDMHAMTFAWDVCRLQPGFNKEVLQWRVRELEDDIATVEFVSESRGSGQIKTRPHRPLSSSTLYNLPDKHESREITTRVNTNDWPRRMTTGQADMN